MMVTMGMFLLTTWYQLVLQPVRKISMSEEEVVELLYLNTTTNKKCTDKKKWQNKEMKKPP